MSEETLCLKKREFYDQLASHGLWLGSGGLIYDMKSMNLIHLRNAYLGCLEFDSDRKPFISAFLKEFRLRNITPPPPRLDIPATEEELEGILRERGYSDYEVHVIKRER